MSDAGRAGGGAPCLAQGRTYMNQWQSACSPLSDVQQCLLKEQHSPLPLMVVMDLETLQFPTPRLVTAATFQMRRSVNVNECHQQDMMQTERG